ncbi:MULTISPECIES: hypothetical protein [unclassified Pseudomonas]|uniref:hypothetical protein n=1 Tax=unclassified Pseudomonas TaxID=196821 RepID=UPI002B234A1A|nr:MULTISPECIES: hypothetical protein [unclassified Pseudomonas]MEA9979450.1 hypothetical protein [Pseudomonas sp. RTS4]MEB0197915.1 hypothetical protein [Pseudomonas sp. 5S4]MEB0246399.1 hypothetical protein [Pseudomonas sp. 10S5]
MKLKCAVILLAGMISGQAMADLQQVCQIVKNATIVSQDSANTFLGKISSSYDTNSVFNEYGTYGNQYSGVSMWNNYSKFGNSFDPFSAFNTSSGRPPMIIRDGQVLGYLTLNTVIGNSLSPNALRGCKKKL